MLAQTWPEQNFNWAVEQIPHTWSSGRYWHWCNAINCNTEAIQKIRWCQRKQLSKMIIKTKLIKQSFIIFIDIGLCLALVMYFKVIVIVSVINASRAKSVETRRTLLSAVAIVGVFCFFLAIISSITKNEKRQRGFSCPFETLSLTWVTDHDNRL